MSTETKKTVPPYATYKSFSNLISDLRENGIPDHITLSVLKGSNSGKAMMTATLKSLGLISDDRKPTSDLTQLAESEANYSTVLSRVIRKSYPFLFLNGIDLSNTTTEKVAEKFKEAGASGSTISKCMAFFLHAVKDTDIVVSDRVKAPPPPRNTTKKKKTPAVKGQQDGLEHDLENDIPEGMERITVPMRGMEDGVILFPAVLEEGEAKKAVKMAVFILNNFYGIDDE